MTCGQLSDNSSDLGWLTQKCMSQDLCVIDPTGVEAFCAIEPKSASVCASNDPIAVDCEGNKLVYCSYGWVTGSEACLTCSAAEWYTNSDMGCPGTYRSPCTNSNDCVTGLTCVNNMCRLTCDCPNGADCPVCSNGETLDGGSISRSTSCTDNLCD